MSTDTGSQPRSRGVIVHTSEKEITIGNDFLSRTFDISDSKVRTTYIVNRRSGRILVIRKGSAEFAIHLMDGTTLNGSDFTLQSWEANETGQGGKELVFVLVHEGGGLEVRLRIQLNPDDFFLRKRLDVTCRDNKPKAIDRIDLEWLNIGWQGPLRAFAPRNADASWILHLGQPVYAQDFFFGVEFAASDNKVGSNRTTVVAGYDWGRTIGESSYTTHSCVCGAARDTASLKDDFLEYIERVRCHPVRMHCQYNTWWEYAGDINTERFVESVQTMDRELRARHAPTMDSYMLDDGWWTHGSEAWDVDTSKFPGGLSRVQSEVEARGARLALWLSPGNGYGQSVRLAELGHEMVDKIRKNGTKLACLAGSRHTEALKKKFLWYMTNHNVNSWKLDGFITRWLVCDDPNHGHPVGKEGRYYVTALTEAWAEIFQAMRAQNPDVFIYITCNTWTSPWFLMDVDSVWMNTGDDREWHGEGTERDQELTARDAACYRAFCPDQAARQFPLSSVCIPDPVVYQVNPTKQRFGPSKLVNKESLKDFRKYVFMCLSRGTPLVEFGISPMVINEEEWDVVADGLKWVKRNFPALSRTRMIGGNPAAGQVYGYSGWTEEQGVVSLRNPSSLPQTFLIGLNRFVGVPSRSGPFRRKTTLSRAKPNEQTVFSYGETIAVTLDPFEVVLWQFDKDDTK